MVSGLFSSKNFVKILMFRFTIFIFVFFKTKNFPKNFFFLDLLFFFWPYIFFKLFILLFCSKNFFTSFYDLFSIVQIESNSTFFTYHLHLHVTPPPSVSGWAGFTWNAGWIKQQESDWFMKISTPGVIILKINWDSLLIFLEESFCRCTVPTICV